MRQQPVKDSGPKHRGGGEQCAAATNKQRAAATDGQRTDGYARRPSQRPRASGKDPNTTGTQPRRHGQHTNHPKHKSEDTKLPIDPKRTQGSDCIRLGLPHTLATTPLAAEVLGEARTDQANVTSNLGPTPAPGRRREHRSGADPTRAHRIGQRARAAKAVV